MPHLGWVLLLSLNGRADTSKNCFNFGHKITQTLRAPVSDLGAVDHVLSGEFSDPEHEGQHWAAVRGRVPAPISDVFAFIVNPETTRGRQVDEMEVKKFATTDPLYLQHYDIHSVVKPFFFLTIEWDMEWGVSLVGGTVGDPKSILASYEKVRGTSHIPHLCGDILITSVDPKSTDVYLYEEVQATGRSEKDTTNGLLGTLKTLREKLKK